MKATIRRVTTFLKSEDGPTASEYAIMLSLIVLAAMGSIHLLGSKMDSIFTYIGSNLPSEL